MQHRASTTSNDRTIGDAHGEDRPDDEKRPPRVPAPVVLSEKDVLAIEQDEIRGPRAGRRAPGPRPVNHNGPCRHVQLVPARPKPQRQIVLLEVQKQTWIKEPDLEQGVAPEDAETAVEPADRNLVSRRDRR